MEKINQILSRVEDLESMQRNRRTQRVRNTGLMIYPGFSLRAENPYAVGRAGGRGRLSLLVKLNMSVASTGRVVLYIDSERASFSNFEKTGKIEQTMFFSARISGEGVIKIEAENGFVGHIDGLEIVLIGDEASLVGTTTSFAADASGNRLGVLTSEDENLTIQIYETWQLSYLGSQSLGFSSIADICGDDNGGFYAAFVDQSRNFFIVHDDGRSGVMTHLVAQKSDISSVAVMKTNTEVVAAFVEKGRVFWLSAPLHFSSFSQPNALENQKADRVAFVKNFTVPHILLTIGNRIFMRFNQRELLKRAKKEFKVKIGARLL